ncbi:GNAT family N-acetyltransferase [Cellulomonas sp. PhB143]|uniref:GNAT family N-acetyltransferase n=1 Tax=Cellulomonas sp. PhB143 TaxID=2485186 RepID=UPI000FBC2FB2|nr:GNAT family N-acetyltransferase [Cellulomonas sp. PhB143]ROS76509.1 ribosomal protein S18 acetylase RimI-like enzyme [Cellulomonas sp. PhB143]
MSAIGSPPAAAPDLELVPFDDPDAVRLREVQQAELAATYGVAPGQSDVGDPVTGDAAVATVVLREAGVPVACGTVRDVSGAPDGRGGRHPDGTGEVKRVFVDPSCRGRGLSKAVMAALESHAAQHGLRSLVLETGTRQPEAIGLYLALGYVPTERYGAYVAEADSRCFAKPLAAGGPGAPVPAAPPGQGERRRPVDLAEVAWDHPDAAVLRREMFETTNLARYPEDFAHLAEPAAFAASDAGLGRSVLVTVLASRDGRALGCASVRVADAGSPAGAAELSKVFVRAEARRTGVATALLDAAEQAARSRGFARLLLGTGPRQPEALATYRRRGYRPVLPFPPYDAFDSAFCLGLVL